MRRVLPLLLCAFGFAGCNDSSTPPQPVASAPVKTSAETAQKPEAFEASEFCQQFHCKLTNSWNIKAGTNYWYDISLPEVMAEIQTTWNSPYASGGLTFVDQVLSEPQWKAIGLF